MSMKVSVWMSAYNHGKYLAQCLDSVLSQKTNFDFDIILGEDCSADNTREIAISYQKKFPDKIKLFLPEKNIGMMEMDVATWELCKGEYLALLNGDDFWTDGHKLQTQVDFLESNPDTVMCYHKAKVIYEETGDSFETVYLEPGDTLPVESLLAGYNPVMTPTVMIRNILKAPEWYAEMPYGDMLIYLLLSQKGKIKYIDKLMSVYRIHSSGQWQGASVYKNLMKDLKFYEVMNEKLDFKYDNLIKKIFSHRYFDLIICCINKNDFAQAKEFYERMESSDPDFLKNNESDLNELREILYDGKFTQNHEQLLKREVKWKIN